MDLMSAKNAAFCCFPQCTICNTFLYKHCRNGKFKKKREKEMIELSLLYNVIILQNTKGEVLLHCKKFYFKV